MLILSLYYCLKTQQGNCGYSLILTKKVTKHRTYSHDNQYYSKISSVGLLKIKQKGP